MIRHSEFVKCCCPLTSKSKLSFGCYQIERGTTQMTKQIYVVDGIVYFSVEAAQAAKAGRK